MTMKTSLPKDLLAELLLFLSEQERFPSVTKHLKGTVTVAEVRGALRQLASRLTEEARQEAETDTADDVYSTHLSSKSREIIASLSSQDEQKLLEAFGLLAR